ncbi:MAG: hypothetical protein K2H91_11845 [Lachnospiraceae bacterium]|nr:hypothetical protein [Lachnospiraceae bacterium]
MQNSLEIFSGIRGDKQCICVICSDEIAYYEEAGYDIIQFDACAVAFRENKG